MPEGSVVVAAAAVVGVVVVVVVAEAIGGVAFLTLFTFGMLAALVFLVTNIDV